MATSEGYFSSKNDLLGQPTIIVSSALNEVENNQTSHAGWNNTWHEKNDLIITLPGRGVSNPTCGEWRYLVRCGNKDDLRATGEIYKYSCHRPTCPICYQSAARQKALDIVKLMDGKTRIIEAELKEQHRTMGISKHYVFSIPPWLMTEEDLLEGRQKDLQRILRDLMDYAFQNSWYAGVTIFHSHRLQRPDGSVLTDEEEQEREQGDIQLNDLVPVWGPHFHFYGFGYLMHYIKFRRDTGWIYKRVKEAPGKRRDAFSTIFYLLTHFGVTMRRREAMDPLQFHGQTTTTYEMIGQSYKWAGEFRPHKTAHTVLDHVLTAKRCEHCGEIIYKYQLGPENQPIEEGKQPFLIRLEKVVYYRVDRKAPDRGRSNGIIIDEISEFENLVSVSQEIECKAILHRHGMAPDPYAEFDHDAFNYGA